MKRMISLAAALMALMLLLGGCAGAPKSANDMAYTASESYDGGYPMEAPAAMEEPAYDEAYDDYAAPAEATEGLGTTDTTSLTTPDYGGRKVIRNVTVSLETDAFDDNVDALLKKVNEVGGYVESSNVDGKKPEVYNDPGRYGYFTFRIPVDRVDEFVADAKGYGTLRSSYESAEDITSRYFDTETRLSVLRTQLDRLTSILVETDNLADVIELESEIARVTLEIEELTTELRRYDGLVSFATVSVNLQELRLSQGPAAEKTVGERIGEDFVDSLYGVGTFCVDVFVWIVGALPVLLFIAAIGLGIFFIIRGGKKRRAKRAERRAQKLAKKAAKLGYNMDKRPAEAQAAAAPETQTGEKAETEEKNND